jgi:Sulfotransferase family
MADPQAKGRFAGDVSTGLIEGRLWLSRHRLVDCFIEIGREGTGQSLANLASMTGQVSTARTWRAHGQTGQAGALHRGGATMRSHPAINRLLRATWRYGLLPRPTIDPDALIAAARRKSGLDDLGDPSLWRPNFDRLCDGLARDARLNPLGLAIAHGQLAGILRDRLRAHALWHRHPEIAEIPLPSPIIIAGQMRSGSTRLQRLFACDPQLAHTRFFESWHPFPGRSLFGKDVRELRSAAGLRAAHTLNPQFALLHPTAATAPDEELGFHAFSLFGSVFEAQWRVPDFARHCETMDSEPVYAEFRRLLQTVAWSRRAAGADSADRPWVIKVPQMTQDLPSVLHVFPDARLVFIDRDPDALVASSASLVCNQMVVQSDHVDRQWIGREWLRKIALRQHRIADFRSTHGGPKVDVGFDAMNRDWLTQMQRLYRGLGMRLDRSAQDRMSAYITASQKLRLDRHQHHIANFGISREDVALALKP